MTSRGNASGFLTKLARSKTRTPTFLPTIFKGVLNKGTSAIERERELAD